MSTNFDDLRVYKISIELAGNIKKLADGLPRSEVFRIGDQLIRASQSVPANIAEGFGRKKYKLEFIKFLTYALGSCDELQSHLAVLQKTKLIEDSAYSPLAKESKNLSVKILNFIKFIRNEQETDRLRIDCG